MNATDVLHDYLYRDPDFPVPGPGAPAHLAYPARPTSPAIDFSIVENGYATLRITAARDDVAQAYEDAVRELVSAAGGDPDDVADVERVRSDMGAERFADGVSTSVRTYFLSAAVLRTHAFPLVTPTCDDVDPIDVQRIGDEGYAFTARYFVMPRGEISSFDPVDAEIPAQPEIGQDEILAEMRRAAGSDELPAQDSDEYASLREGAVARLGRKANGDWSDEVMTACNHALAGRLVSDPPAGYLVITRNQMANEYVAQLESQGVDWNAYRQSPDFDMDQFRAQIAEEAGLALRTSMAVDAMARHIGTMVSQREVLQTVGVPNNDALRAGRALTTMMLTGQLPQICQITRRYKTSDVIARQALRRASERRMAAEAAEAQAEAQAAGQPAAGGVADRIAAAGHAAADAHEAAADARGDGAATGAQA